MDSKINYQLQLDNIIKNLDGKKPRLLLHACCAPCSSYCLEYLKNYFDITLFFYNPNISSAEEWEKRLNELKRLVKEMSLNFDIVCPQYDQREFLDKVRGFEECPEGGDRCGICYALRLKKSCDFAEENAFDYYCSTLSISPHKNAQKLNAIGEALASGKKVKHLPNDFKKKGGYLRSIELSKKHNLYRQDFCGCVYSQTNKSI
ncbi:MAG: epoxyqueuosine reductase QueH [Clostridia bacterium]|nr:epoxyqueuosine reductase QueH [Clostridia bacterium]